MPPVVIDVRAADDLRDVVHRAVQAVTEGELVVFPTETVYGVAARAMDPEAVERLAALKGRKPGHPFTLAVQSAEEARDYAPNMGEMGNRLARRCWPGPITLVVGFEHPVEDRPESFFDRLPPSVRQIVSPTGTVGLRVPGHQIILEVLRMMAGPLVLSSANQTGQPDATNAQEVIDALGDGCQLVLDDGPSRFEQPSSVVRVEGKQWEMLRSGVVPESTIAWLSSVMVLFVCTGNTCRSPMAEAIFRKMAAKRLGCSPDDLEDRGLTVASAGIAAMSGGRASAEAVEVVASMGLNLGLHAAQPLTESLVRGADRIYTMTRSHRQAIVAQWPQAAERTQMLSPNGEDVSDPIGGPIEHYQQCAEQIGQQLMPRLDELDL